MLFHFLAAEIPARQAEPLESLKLMAQGWGSIFLVILLIMLCVFLLNTAFRSKK